ncbi:MAG: aldo/keto reductase [Prevotellaceae bacterium]|jgi:alcohol dehydrogenase (NADP+)|nr:aldo/keto reductase [Prevotellaceae bacterium]
MKKLKFKNGDELPPIGLGTWLSKPHEVYDAVLEAIRCGYRHIDCAYVYKNEIEVGMALDYAFRYGIVKREELFVTSKLWNSDHDPERTENAINRTLSNLQLKKLDLYLIHWPVAFAPGKDFANSAGDLVSLRDMPLSITWQAMYKLKQKGLTAHIGVSNFNIPKLRGLVADTKIKPEVNQVEMHPFLQQNDLLAYCQEQSILVTAYSPLGSRHLIKTDEGIHSHPVIIDIARKHQCAVSQVILAWGMKRGTSVIPKSVNEERIRENFGALKIKLDGEDMEKISAIDKNLRLSNADFCVLPKGSYTYKSIWEE